MRAYSRNFLTAFVVAAALCTPALAQDSETGSETIGPPQLREFQLPGTTTTPAPQQEPPATPPSTNEERPQPAAPPPEAATAPSPRQAPPNPAEERRLPDAVAERPQTAEAPPATTRPTPTQVEEQPTATSAPVAPNAAVPDASQPASVESPASSALPNALWLYLLAGVALLMAGFAAWKARAARKERQYGEETHSDWTVVSPEKEASASDRQFASTPTDSPRSTFTPTPPSPAPEPVTPAAGARNDTIVSGVVGVQIRPWLNLEFTPAQAAATLTEAVVQFELLVRNSGNAVARNVRIEAQMFNAGVEQDKEIAEFFSRPAEGHDGSRILAIPPRSGARLRSNVTMPKEQVREITVEGRRLFIPMVAFNVFYEWGEGRRGQTSMSYLVGREGDRPSTKMGAFRLDLGPRIYRSVGQRPNKVAVLV